MSGERSGVHQHRVIADLAVVTNMRVRHDQNVTAYLCRAAALIRSAIDGDVLANDVVVADFQPRGLTAIGNVLRLGAERGEREYPVVVADAGGTVNHHMRDKLAVLAELNIGADYAVRSDRTRRWHFRTTIHNGC